MTIRIEPTPQQLELLTQTIRDVARFNRLSADDAEDFAQNVQLRALERHYDIFSRFMGRSSLRTYLRIVVKRMLLDWRNAKYGKWRPSAAAIRLGNDAVTLERLVYRDGYSVDEAVELLTMRPAAPPAADVRRLAEQVPPRHPRRSASERFLSEVDPVEFEDPIDARDRGVVERRRRQALATALEALPVEDRWLLTQRYSANRRVRELAEALQEDPKALYRRFDRLLRSLRASLAAAAGEPTGNATGAGPSARTA
jgi:RNA polymerase sigma factor (sigma-70 family)